MLSDTRDLFLLYLGMNKNKQGVESAPGALPPKMTRAQMEKALKYDVQTVLSLFSFVQNNEVVRNAILDEMFRIQEAHESNVNQTKLDV